MTSEKRSLKVFLCHASQDKPAARDLYNALKAEGWIDPWLDKTRILPGQDWRAVIESAVEESDVVIVCLSTQSVSKEGFVQREMKYAYDIALEKPEGTIFLIPLRLDDCVVPRGLRSFHWVNYFEGEKSSAYSDLLNALRLRHEQKLKLEEALARQEEERRDREAAENAAAARAKWEAIEQARREREERRANQVAARKAQFRKSFAAVRSFVIQALAPVLIFSLGAFAVVAALIWGVPKLTALLRPPQDPATFASRFTITPSPAATELLAEVTDQQDVSMRLVPAGEFVMGSDIHNDERPIHSVYLDAFYIDTYEVTNGPYDACVRQNVCDPPKAASSKTRPSYYPESEYSNYPVLFVNWNQARTYCVWRGANLPTEAQWEKAARGIDGRSYPWGEELDCSKANYGDCTGDTTEVGSYESGVSPYGLYDMAGNASEWVRDWYSSTYYEVSPLYNPLGPDKGVDLFGRQILRGGSWLGDEDLIRTTDRYAWVYNPNPQLLVVAGFRCARTP